MRSLAVVPLLLAAAWAQENPSATGRYENKELGIEFTGVYGWETKFAQGSGAWTELASYTDESLGAVVTLLVRDNPYETSADLRKALAEEFKGADGDGGGYKEVTIKPADMKKGNRLPGFEVEAFIVKVTEGKTREHKVVSRTYFGANRLFRVHCSVGRARLKRVRDLFERAAAGLVVTGSDEKVMRGQPFTSVRGRYGCLVPEGFVPTLPGANWNMDMRFVRRGGVSIDVYSYAYDGILADHVDELSDHYGDKIKFENEETKVLGGTGLLATVERDKRVTLLACVVMHKRIYRVHTTAPTDALADAKDVHAQFLKGMRIQR